MEYVLTTMWSAPGLEGRRSSRYCQSALPCLRNAPGRAILLPFVPSAPVLATASLASARMSNASSQASSQRPFKEAVLAFPYDSPQHFIPLSPSPPCTHPYAASPNSHATRRWHHFKRPRRSLSFLRDASWSPHHPRSMASRRRGPMQLEG